MCSPRLLILALLCAFVSRADEPLRSAEDQFVLQINSLEGIELAGGPFKTAERYSFSGISGYFVLAPQTAIASLDQRLTVQLRLLELNQTKHAHASLAAPPFASDIFLTAEARSNLLERLAANAFGEACDELTLLGDGSVRARSVSEVPVLAVRSLAEDQIAVLLGAQPWQGVPLAKIGIDRKHGDSRVSLLRCGYFARAPHEIQFLPAPVFTPQTFFADRGVPAAEWVKALAALARINDLPPQIVGAEVTDDNLVFSLDFREPILPAHVAAFRESATGWEMQWAVEVRAQIPQPAAWWTFLPLLERRSGPETARAADRFDCTLPQNDKREIAGLVLRMRGAGAPVSMEWDGAAATVKTSAGGFRGWKIEFRKIGSAWRLAGLRECAS